MKDISKFVKIDLNTQGSLEDTLIEPLTGQGSSKRFVIDDTLVYGVNKNNQLWSYDLNVGELMILPDVTRDIDYLTDVKDNELLVTVVIAAKKEAIELSVAN